MAKNDYFVLMFRILAYLYECLKQDEYPDLEYLHYSTEAFPIGQRYWNTIWTDMYQEGYISGIKLLPILGQVEKDVRLSQATRITAKGIEYLEDNSKMNKVKGLLKELKEIVPGL